MCLVRDELKFQIIKFQIKFQIINTKSRGKATFFKKFLDSEKKLPEIFFKVFDHCSNYQVKQFYF